MEKRRFDKIDGIYALFIAFIQFTGYIVILTLHFGDHKFSLEYYQSLFSIIIVLMIGIYMLIRKQGLSTVGINYRSLGKSLLLGVIYSIIYICVFLIIRFPWDLKISNDLSYNLSQALYFLVSVALFEELLYRGFISSRLRGLFNNKYVTLIIGGMLFSLVHLPYHSTGYSSLTYYFKSEYPYHFILFFLHIIFQSVYDKYNNLAAPVILHFVYDYLLWIFI